MVQAPLSEPSMLSWVPLFTPDPGTIIKDMDVVGNHCVLVARIPTGEFVLIVVPLAHPNEVYTVQVSTKILSLYFLSSPPACSLTCFLLAVLYFQLLIS